MKLRWPGAIFLSRKLSKRTNFADASGLAFSTSARSGKPVQGIAIDQASTQRWR